MLSLYVITMPIYIRYLYILGFWCLQQFTEDRRTVSGSLSLTLTWIPMDISELWNNLPNLIQEVTWRKAQQKTIRLRTKETPWALSSLFKLLRCICCPYSKKPLKNILPLVIVCGMVDMWRLDDNLESFLSFYHVDPKN